MYSQLLEKRKMAQPKESPGSQKLIIRLVLEKDTESILPKRLRS